jgi:hypothetical protein
MLGGPFTFGGQYALGAGPVGSALSGVKLYLDGAPLAFQDGSLDLETALNERAVLSFSTANSATPPVDGQRVVLTRDEERLFAGHIWSTSLRIIENKKASYLDVRCVDLAQALERQVKLKTYTDQSARMIVEELLANDLNAEGIWAGRIEEGARFPLVDADDVRVSELMRDVADGAGLLTWVDPFGRLHLVQALADVAPFAIQAGTAGKITVEKTKETYRNVAIVTCRSASGSASVRVERSGATEIAARQAREGGSGRYEVHTRIQHPSSNDTVEMQRLATTYAVIQLSRSNALRQVLKCTTFTHGLQVGQVVPVNLPEYQASGSWTITKARMRQLALTKFQYEIEAVQSSLFDRLHDAYLQIVGAGRATVQLAVGIFANTVEFLSNGNWVVPGSGSVEIEIDGFAPGGGGGGYDGVGPSGTGLNGGVGGAGGKAVTFLSLAAGSTLDIVVPAAGSGGLGANATTVNFTTPTTTTWVVPGTGNVRVEMTVNGAGGGSGSKDFNNPGQCSGAGGNGGRGVSWRVYPAGTVLDVIVGAAGAGGVAGAGGAGGLSRVSLSGGTIAEGAGGGGGAQMVLVPPQTNGTPGGGTGDTVTSGGAVGFVSTVNGQAGSAGKVQIRY